MRIVDGMSDGVSTTIDVDGGQLPTMPELQLVVVGPDTLTTVPLAKGRQYLIGRGDDAHVRLADQSASRLHVRLTVGEADIDIEDLQSANGTLVAGAALVAGERRPLRAGEAVTIGSTMLMLQRLPSGPQRRRIWSHVYFLGRLEEECWKAPHMRTAFAVVRLRLTQALTDGQIGRLLSGALRPFDLVARYGARDWELLLPGCAASEAQTSVAAILAELGAANAAGARAGIAVHGADGRSPSALLAAASAKLYDDAVPTDTAASAERRALVAVAPRMRDVLRLAEKAARSDSAGVLILGETGAGKTVLSTWIHDRSPRAQGPFVRVDLGALTPSLIESELFGHARGAFSGATKDKPGLLEEAAGGTLHLDEVGELPPDLQLKLLTALQEREIRRVGETQARRIDVRVIASTNRDLRAAMAAGEFRNDLYFRLAVLTLVVPPLRQRRAEIEVLARTFLSRFAPEEKLPFVPDLSEEALHALESHDWPGNVRELENAIRRALVLCSGSTIEAEDLGLDDALHDVQGDTTPSGVDDDLSELDQSQLRDRRALLTLLGEHRWVIERAAEARGVAKGTLYRSMRTLRIPLRRRDRAR